MPTAQATRGAWRIQKRKAHNTQRKIRASNKTIQQVIGQAGFCPPDERKVKGLFRVLKTKRRYQNRRLIFFDNGSLEIVLTPPDTSVCSR
jgi:hypothetical protein